MIIKEIITDRKINNLNINGLSINGQINIMKIDNI